jgi:hypothetical protein
LKIFWNVVGSPLEGVIGLGSNGSSFPTTGGATTPEVALEIVEAPIVEVEVGDSAGGMIEFAL